MESASFDPSHARRTAARAEAAPFIDYPPTPLWFFPAGGAWAAAYLALLGLRNSHQVWLVVGMVGLSALLGAFLSWYGRYHGAMPRMRHAPGEIRRAYLEYAVGVLVVGALIALAWVALGHLAAVAAGFLTVTAGLAVYERAYAAAARRTRERLG